MFSWFLVWIIAVFGLLPQPRPRSKPTLAWHARRRYGITKAKLKPDYLKSSTKESLLHARIMAGIEHPEITKACLIILPLFIFSSITLLTGHIEWMFGNSLFLVGSAIEPREILGTGIVEAYAPEFGATNNSAKLQAAIDYGETNDKHNIYLGNNAWQLSTQILFPKGTESWVMTGYTLEGTILTSTVNGTSVIETEEDISVGGADRVDGIILRNFTLNGGGSETDGISLLYPSFIHPAVVDNVYVDGCGQHGIYFDHAIVGNVINTYSYNNTSRGFEWEYSNDLTFFTCRAVGNSIGFDGSYSDNTLITGCTSEQNTSQGILIGNNGWNNTIESCWLEDNDVHGINVQGNDATDRVEGTNVKDNFINGRSNANYGTITQFTQGTMITGNTYRNHLVQSIRLGFGNNDADLDLVENNYCEDTNFVQLTTGCTDCEIGKNRFSGTSTFITDAGTNTRLQTVSFPFVYATGGATVSTTGILINAAGETASAMFRIPNNCNQVVSIDALFRTAVTEADAMVVDILINAGAEDEPYNTHQTNSDAQQSETTNFTASDIIRWRNTDATVIAITGGDSGNYDLLYRVATGDDCETNGRAQTIEVRYV